MGKAGSKQSVNITTEPSKEIQEGSGELKKLDDSYFKENESSVSVEICCLQLTVINTSLSLYCNLLQDKENKVTNDAVENEKNESVKEEENATVEEPTAAAELDENKVETAVDDKTTTEEIKKATPEPESAAKKEKLKKKWSFRSLSFGRKDKQKKDRKNEESKAVAEGAEEATEDKSAEEKAQEPETTHKESKTLEPVVETIKEEAKPEESTASAPIPEPVQAVVEPVKETPEPIVVPKVEEKTEVVEEKPIPAEVTELPAPVEQKPTNVSKLIDENLVEAEEHVVQQSVEEPPAIPATPPPSQCSVFVESMHIDNVEESIPVPAEIDDLKDQKESNGETHEIDIEPVAEMLEKVLEEAVDSVEAEIADKTSDEELPPPPADELIETPPATEVIVEVKPNGVGDHNDEPVKVNGSRLFSIT